MLRNSLKESTAALKAAKAATRIAAEQKSHVEQALKASEEKVASLAATNKEQAKLKLDYTIKMAALSKENEVGSFTVIRLAASKFCLVSPESNEYCARGKRNMGPAPKRKVPCQIAAGDRCQFEAGPGGGPGRRRGADDAS